MKKECYFCGNEENVIVSSLTNTKNGELAPICHVCFNKASVLDSGLLHNGTTIYIDKPRLILGVDYWYKKEGE